MMLDLFVNPEYSQFIQKLETIHLLDGNAVVLKTGESFECLFKLKIGDLPEEEDFTSVLGGGARTPLLQKPSPSDNAVQRMFSLFSPKQLDIFAELQFKFQSIEQNTDLI